jgi:hypothetical protein
LSIMASIGSGSGNAAKQPSNHGSGSDDGNDDGKVSSSRGSAPRRSGRQRTMSADGAESVANNESEAEYLAKAKAEYARRNNRSAAPSTIVAPGGANTRRPSVSSSLPLFPSPASSSSVPSLVVSSVSSLAAAAATQPQQLHGVDAARTAHALVADNKVSSSLPSLEPSIDDRSSGQRERYHRRSSHRHRRDRHRSPSVSSSSSSDDELTRGQHSLYYDGHRIKPRKQWRLSAMRSVRARYGSFAKFFEDAKVTTVRNKYEGEELAAVLDQLFIARDHIGQPPSVITLAHITRACTAVDVAMELATRRLQGIIKADQSGGDWSFANSLSLLKRAELGNDDLNRSVNLDVTRTRAATKANNNSKGNGRGNGGNDSSSRRNRRQWRNKSGKGDDSNNNTKSSSNDKAGSN